MTYMLRITSLCLFIFTMSAHTIERDNQKRECIKVVHQMLQDSDTIDANDAKKVIATIRETCPDHLPSDILIDAAASDDQPDEKRDEIYLKIINAAKGEMFRKYLESQGINPKVAESVTYVASIYANNMMYLQKKMYEKRERNRENK